MMLWFVQLMYTLVINELLFFRSSWDFCFGSSQFDYQIILSVICNDSSWIRYQYSFYDWSVNFFFQQGYGGLQMTSLTVPRTLMWIKLNYNETTISKLAFLVNFDKKFAENFSERLSQGTWLNFIDVKQFCHLGGYSLPLFAIVFISIQSFNLSVYFVFELAFRISSANHR